MQNGVKKQYSKIQKELISLIPENWESICLYASVINGVKGEMYFYYFPKKLIKSKPVNCYEVANKFGIEDAKYNRKLKKLYDDIKELNTYSFPKWTNITIVIKNNIFTIECRYNDLVNSPYTDEERRLIWSCKYLNTPMESISLKDRALIQTYNDDSSINPTVYSEFLNFGEDNRELEEKPKIKYVENDENQVVKNRILKY